MNHKYDPQYKWNKNHPEHRKRIMRNGVARLRSEMIAAYGGLCAECGENDPIVLVLDHINDDAKIDGHGGHNLYRKLRKLKWPKDRFRLLCHNCNYRKEFIRRKRLCQA